MPEYVPAAKSINDNLQPRHKQPTTIACRSERAQELPMAMHYHKAGQRRKHSAEEDEVRGGSDGVTALYVSRKVHKFIHV